jgi:hypothetical protein
MSEYDPGPLFEDLRKEHEEKRKITMHPYRDDNDIKDIRENIEHIKETLENLKLPKRSAIGQAIGYKIERFNLGDFLFNALATILVLSALGGIGYIAYMNTSTPDNAITACQYDFRNLDREDGITITAVIEWHQDEVWGPFRDMEEAKAFAKENHCPE